MGGTGGDRGGRKVGEGTALADAPPVAATHNQLWLQALLLLPTAALKPPQQVLGSGNITSSLSSLQPW